MARYDDRSDYVERWTNAKLIAEARTYANLENFAAGYFDGPDAHFKPGWASQTGSPDIADFCREQTRIYRESNLPHIFAEIERRLCKPKKEKRA